MTEFRVTFPQRFRDQTHKRLAAAHPDGWLRVEAPSKGLARDMAFFYLGQEWAFIYGPTDDGYPTIEQYRLGEIGLIIDTTYGETEEDG